ncbi:MAG: hypothetical protein DLM66_13710 [Candidatus Dormiibacter spiritus]|nr:MAG: hypothetical protein DLM66_13710 [Candidatus Dormibacteraeota bacterium]
MRQLEEARKHIRAGEDYQALTAALDKFSAVVKAPYNPDSWLELLKDDEPAQRREAISQELGRHCTLLNRVGWHRGATESDEGQHHRMPLDHWEAELLVATSQFLLTYAIRLKMISPNAHQG